MVGGIHYRDAGPVGQGDDDARRAVRRPRLARYRGRLERGGVAGPRVPVPAARRALRDARGDAPDRPRDVRPASAACEAAFQVATSRRRDSSTRPSRSRGPASRSWSAAAASGRRCASSPSTPTRATCSARPRAIARKYAILDAHCAAVGRDPAEIERTTLQNVRARTADRGTHGVGTGRSSTASGSCRDAGAEHVIFELKDVHGPTYLETAGREIVPALHALP